jgi:spore germination protein GerM
MIGCRLAMTLLAVSVMVLSGCNGRKILHGNGKAHHKRNPANACATDAGKMLNVCFVKSEASGLAMINVARKASRGDRLQQAVEELLRGPNSNEEKTGLGTEIPRGTILLGMNRKGNDIELNLSRRFASGGGSTSFLTRLEQLRKTVAGPAGAANVYLSVEGHRLNVEEGEGIEIHQPINR